MASTSQSPGTGTDKLEGEQKPSAVGPVRKTQRAPVSYVLLSICTRTLSVLSSVDSAGAAVDQSVTSTHFLRQTLSKHC
jgi:hypothetical protein